MVKSSGGRTIRWTADDERRIQGSPDERVILVPRKSSEVPRSNFGIEVPKEREQVILLISFAYLLHQTFTLL